MSDILTVRNPYNREIIEELPLHNALQAEKMLSNAYRLSCSGAILPKHERITILERLITLMEANIDTLTHTAAEEGGKPYIDSRVEALRAVAGVKNAIVSLSTLHGEEIPMGITEASQHRLAFTMKEPIGVVFAISAFNHPLNLIIHQVIPAIAVGCPVIIKPASTTPRSCLALVDLLYQAGLPEEWCSVLLCTNKVAEDIATDQRVNFLTFIGSAKVGWYLRSRLAAGTRYALEHGGSAPVIVESDYAISQVLPPLAKGGLYHAGQVCVSVQRVFVKQTIAEELAYGLRDIAKSYKTGNQLLPETEAGPLIKPQEVTRVHEWVQEAIQGGAKLLCGGEPISETCYTPTILLNPSDNVKVSQEEIFGPVICVYSYNDRDNALQRANGLPYHFQASVFTQNIDTALDCVKRLNATAVMVNDHTAFRVDWMPFGGRDTSGAGLGGIPYSMEDMTREKLMILKSPSL